MAVGEDTVSDTAYCSEGRNGVRASIDRSVQRGASPTGFEPMQTPIDDGSRPGRRAKKRGPRSNLKPYESADSDPREPLLELPILT